MINISFYIAIICIILRHSEGYHFTTHSLSSTLKRKNNNLVMFSDKDKYINIYRCNEYAKYVRTNERWGGKVIGPLVRYFNLIIIGFLLKFILQVLNTFKVHNQNYLFDAIWNRPKSVGLLTVSNHQSLLDDPGLWAAVIPFWRLRPNSFRWVLCTDDVFFYRKWLQSILAGANGLPIDRGNQSRCCSIEQPILEYFKDVVEKGLWGHLFPEGKIWQNYRFGNGRKLGCFKLGIGKIIAHSKSVPIVIPMYHKGMDRIIPEIEESNIKKAARPRSIIPTIGNEIELFIGKPIDFTDKIEKFKSKYPDALISWKTSLEAIELYREIVAEIRDQILLLEQQAWK